jgi:hypothetical protein
MILEISPTGLAGIECMTVALDKTGKKAGVIAISGAFGHSPAYLPYPDGKEMPPAEREGLYPGRFRLAIRHPDTGAKNDALGRFLKKAAFGLGSLHLYYIGANPALALAARLAIRPTAARERVTPLRRPRRFSPTRLFPASASIPLCFGDRPSLPGALGLLVA